MENKTGINLCPKCLLTIVKIEMIVWIVGPACVLRMKGKNRLILIHFIIH